MLSVIMSNQQGVILQYPDEIVIQNKIGLSENGGFPQIMILIRKMITNREGIQVSDRHMYHQCLFVFDQSPTGSKW